MTRLPRAEALAGYKYFHILTSGIGRSNIFIDDSAKRFYINTVEEKKNDMGVSVLAYCVMNNHSHLVIAANDSVTVSEFMRRVNTTYAKFCNRRYNRSGYVFKGRYSCQPLTDEAMLDSCITFVHNNPCAAKIEYTSQDYPFSSARGYLFNTGIVDFKMLKSVFGRVPELSSYAKGHYDFIEEKPNEDCDAVLIELIHRYNIRNKCVLQDPEILQAAIAELQARCGVSLRDVAVILGIDREKVRRTALKMKARA